MASCHRPLPSQSLCGCVTLSDGDHSVCAPVSTSGGLDGLHRSQGSVSLSAGSSCFSSLSALRVPWHGLQVQSSVLWPLHGSAGLHPGHGSCFSYTPFSGYPYASIPRRLAGPVFLSGVSPRGSSDCSPSLSRVGDCHQSQESNLIPSQVVQYLGVVIDSTSFRASPSVERISRLQSTAAEFQSCASPTASLWLSLLGVLSSLAHFVPGCSPSSSASIVLGTVRIWRLQC